MHAQWKTNAHDIDFTRGSILFYGVFWLSKILLFFFFSYKSENVKPIIKMQKVTSRNKEDCLTLTKISESISYAYRIHYQVYFLQLMVVQVFVLTGRHSFKVDRGRLYVIWWNFSLHGWAWGTSGSRSSGDPPAVWAARSASIRIQRLLIPRCALQPSGGRRRNHANITRCIPAALQTRSSWPTFLAESAQLVA